MQEVAIQTLIKELDIEREKNSQDIKKHFKSSYTLRKNSLSVTTIH